jgi:hypothetical protein
VCANIIHVYGVLNPIFEYLCYYDVNNQPKIVVRFASLRRQSRFSQFYNRISDTRKNHAATAQHLKRQLVLLFLHHLAKSRHIQFARIHPVERIFQEAAGLNPSPQLVLGQVFGVDLGSVLPLHLFYETI